MAIFPDLFAPHLGIVVDVFVLGKPLCLYLSSLYHPFTDRGAAFCFFPLRKFLKGYWIHFYMNVYTIKQGA